MTKTEITLIFETDTPSHVDRVLFEALQRAVRANTDAIEIDVLTGLMVSAMKAESERHDDERHNFNDLRETDTIELAVASAMKGEVDERRRKHLGSIRANKIEAAIAKVKS